MDRQVNRDAAGNRGAAGGAQPGGKVDFLMEAAVIRRDGSPEDLQFDFGAGGKVVNAVPLQQGEHYALPLSVLP